MYYLLRLLLRSRSLTKLSDILTIFGIKIKVKPWKVLQSAGVTEANSDGKHIQEYLHWWPGLFVKVIAKVKGISRSLIKSSEILTIFGIESKVNPTKVPLLAVMEATTQIKVIP